MNPIIFVEKNKNEIPIILTGKGKSLELQLLQEYGFKESKFYGFKINQRDEDCIDTGVAQLISTYDENLEKPNIYDVRLEKHKSNVHKTFDTLMILSFFFIPGLTVYAHYNFEAPTEFYFMGSYIPFVVTGLIKEAYSGKRKTLKKFDKLRETAIKIDDYISKKMTLDTYINKFNDTSKQS